jgi:hypothetical protein
MTEVEIAQVMGCSNRWVRQQWTFARAWLRRALRGRRHSITPDSATE